MISVSLMPTASQASTSATVIRNTRTVCLPPRLPGVMVMRGCSNGVPDC